jgi:hypothetical protein
MKTEVIELIENENISEIEIVEFIETYQTLVKSNILSNEGFVDILNRLGVEQTGENMFSLDEDTEYILP